MEANFQLETQYQKAVQTIKNAILQSQNKAVKLINKEQLALYYGIGRYISQNTRKGFWGKGVISYISNKLQDDLPGLRGFSVTNLRLMRIFYEEWIMLDNNSSVLTDESLSSKNKSSVLTDDLNKATTVNESIELLKIPQFKDFPIEDFFSIGFTHHTIILSQVKTLEERYFYIQKSAQEHLKVDSLKKIIKEDLYHNQGSIPNNFIDKLPSEELAKRAILAFKDEYLLDFINVEELGA